MPDDGVTIDDAWGMLWHAHRIISAISFCDVIFAFFLVLARM
jgi:hypothetical protein